MRVKPTDFVVVGCYVGVKENSEVKNDFTWRSAVWRENQELTSGHMKFEMETRSPYRAVGEGHWIYDSGIWGMLG